MSTLSSAHKMSWSRFLKLGICKLSVKEHPLLFHYNLSNRNPYLQSYYFLSDRTSRCHFSQLHCSHYKAAPDSSFLYISNLQPRDSLFLNPIFVTYWRGLRGFPSNRAGKKVDEKNTEAQAVGKENVDTDLKTEGPVAEAGSNESEATKKLTLYQRFKKTYKEHGKVLVAVHLVTSAVWFGSFYTLASCGFDIVPYLENWNFSERIIAPFRSGGLGDLALAYLLYKLATPARYTVTIGGTNLAIRYLRKEGKMPHVPQEDSVRSLLREGREDLKRRSDARIKRMRRKNRNKQDGELTKDKS